MTHPDDGYCAKHDMWFDIADGLQCPVCEGIKQERHQWIKLITSKLSALYSCNSEDCEHEARGVASILTDRLEQIKFEE